MTNAKKSHAGKDAGYIVRRAKKGTGLGLFATREYKKGEFIIEYTGKKITTKEADKLLTKYLFEINSRWTIDGSKHGNIARYINHACKPNAESTIRKGRIIISAIKRIMPGEEFTYDYGTEYFEEFIKPHGCKCDSCLQKRASPATPARAFVGATTQTR